MMNDTTKPTSQEAAWYQAMTGKPFQTRERTEPGRDIVINSHVAAISSFENRELGCDEFATAFCAVLDMYEAHLDAACDLSDAEIDELCFRLFMPRAGFDRYVRIAKIQKQVPCEIQLGLDNGKKWALDPTLLQE